MTAPLIGNTAVFFFTYKMAGPSNENSIQFNEHRLASIVKRVYTALQGDTLATAQRSSSSAHTSVEDELRSRFQTPRGRVTGGSPISLQRPFLLKIPSMNLGPYLREMH